jgi:catechol 2,3-dioxygenase-like lactoylglutathione lyase family enzyme
VITATRFVIAVLDLEVSAAYYRDVLGFEVRELAPGWRFYELGACRIMAGECADALPPADLGDHSYFAYIVLDDIDAYYGRVRDAGASVLKAPRDEPWGMREFAVRTGDGHRIMFGQQV